MTETKTNFLILNELITNHIMTILNEEMSGWNKIHLYAIGEHWVAFERSAYALSKKIQGFVAYQCPGPEELPISGYNVQRTL